jgi:rhodanese-related sulfurtransferase
MEQIIEFAARHPLMSTGFIVVLAILLWTELKRGISGVKELTPAQAVAWINDPDTVIVDISSAADFNKGHIVNARNIAVSRINSPDAEVQKLSKSKVLVVCKTGQTAVSAAANLKKAGVTELGILKGGMIQWMNDQFPVTRK